VAIVGLPNAGKSTLLNALVGQKLAIVTAKPQTTRHRILGILSGPGHQGLLVDTPGVLATSRTALDGAMMRTVRSVLTQADVLCVVVDGLAASADPASGLEGLALTGAEGGPPLCVLLNKADLLGAEAAEQLRSWYAAQPGVAAVLTASAKLGTGVRELEAWLVGSLPPGPTLYPKDQVSEHPERFFVAECVREQIFELYRQEVPYCTSVSVLEHREGRNGQKDFIRVQVSVERESQKPILLGKGGAAIKQLSSASRAAVEDFLQRPVFLDLTVKVAEGWRDSEELLESFGVTNASRIV
jgi:GTP-binding protein Era